VGGDKMLWEQKYKDAFFEYPTAKLMFATNELPRIRDISDGIWRRMILIPFNAKFTGKQINPDLAKELQQPEELSGILNWMLEGALMLEDTKGFIEPDVCTKALDKYRNESDTARNFMLENTAKGDDKIAVNLVYKCYQEWCKEFGYRAKSIAMFGKSVCGIYGDKKDRCMVDGRRANYYTGLVPVPDSFLADKIAGFTMDMPSQYGGIENDDFGLK
jgi:P4 family phage/plasmid primase-like protien